MKQKGRNVDGTRTLDNHRWSWRHLAFRAFIERLKRSDAPILVGPWRGEIGFEALYWTAFVEWLIQDFKIDRTRMIPISRGGAGAWYGCPQGIELYAMRTPQQIRVQQRSEVMTTGLFKQESFNAFDRQIIRDVVETLKLKRYHVLHPAWMYHLLATFWTGHTGIEWVGKRLRFRTLDSPALPDSIKLPQQFVAVRFYARPTFPVHKLTNAFIGATLEELSSKYDVVILDHELFLDDHQDLTGTASGPRIHHLSKLVDHLTPENNLAMTSGILGRSMGFVGTYGGFGQLALRMGKPSVTYFMDWGNFTSMAHLNLADALSIRTGIPAMVLKISELAMLSSVLPMVEMPIRKPSQFAVAKDKAEA